MTTEEKDHRYQPGHAELALFRALVEEKQWPGAAAAAVARLLERLPKSEVAVEGNMFVTKERRA